MLSSDEPGVVEAVLKRLLGEEKGVSQDELDARRTVWWTVMPRE
jgi:hypothetical protein